jgi:NAD/NADP transhydrogenase alpha subunit
MIIAIPKENREGESRVAASPEVVKKFIGLGLKLVLPTSNLKR